MYDDFYISKIDPANIEPGMELRDMFGAHYEVVNKCSFLILRYKQGPCKYYRDKDGLIRLPILESVVFYIVVRNPKHAKKPELMN